MRWREVAAWRDRLREADLSGVKTDLSPEGLRAAVDAALDGLDDISLQSVGSLPGAPYKRAVVVTAGTVCSFLRHLLQRAEHRVLGRHVQH